MTELTKLNQSCSNCKHFQLDGMFGVWCEKGEGLYKDYCSKFEAKKKTTLRDIDGIVKNEKIDGRFQEIISTQKIKDTKTGREYDGIVDIDFLKLVNDIEKRNQSRKREIYELRESNALLCDVIDGFRSFRILKDKGWYE